MYSVPLIQQDLRHEETVIQSANALEYIDKVIDDIFNRIDARINEDIELVKRLRKRIQEADKQIESLHGINKAIKIFSPAKFPSEHVFHDIPATFPSKLAKTVKFKLRTDYVVESPLDPVNQKNMKDLLKFYHVRTSKETESSEKKKGLGPIPNDIVSVGSLLLYNTSQNIYKDYSHPKAVYRGTAKAKLPRSIHQFSVPPNLGPIPPSIAQGRGVATKFNEGLFYMPQQNEGPEIDAPMDLPDLPGIVEDIVFENNEKEQIAPTLFLGNLPELPEIDNIETLPSDEHTKIGDESSTLVDKSESAAADHQTDYPQNLGEPKAIEQTTKLIPSPPPPPPPLPPPPPPPPPIPSSSQIESAPMPKSSVPVDTPDIRSNLMDAIRKAGGAKGLRAAADASQPSQSEVRPASNLMADLHNKLLMRRKGISGLKNSDFSETVDSTKKTGVMDRISAMIPAPPKPQQRNDDSTSDASNDEDWTE